MTTTLPILVAYDGSPDAQLALRWAAAESIRTRIALHVLAVNAVLPPTWGGVAGMVVITDPMEGDSSALLEQAEKVLADEGVVTATTEQCSGHVVEELLRAAEHASVLVVGSHGHGRANGALLGSVSQHLVPHASCPVVVVREPRDSRARRIVVGVDGSPTSAAALAWACQRAEGTGETVVAIHGWHARTPATDVWGSHEDTVGNKDRAAREGRELLLAESIAGLRVDHPDVRVEHEVIAMAPAQCLVDASESASLLVVGSRGRGMFSSMLIGSVSQAVLHAAACPVVVVR